MSGIDEILRTRQFPGIVGTRDNFGINKAFYDEKTKTYIDTWPKWRKAGFKDPKENMNPAIKDRYKYEYKRRKHRGDKQFKREFLT